MNDARVSSSWSSRHACLVVDWEEYDGRSPLSKNAIDALRADCPAARDAYHGASVSSIRRGVEMISQEILCEYFQPEQF
jgi:hypothetical protein